MLASWNRGLVHQLSRATAPLLHAAAWCNNTLITLHHVHDPHNRLSSSISQQLVRSASMLSTGRPFHRQATALPACKPEPAARPQGQRSEVVPSSTEPRLLWTPQPAPPLAACQAHTQQSTTSPNTAECTSWHLTSFPAATISATSSIASVASRTYQCLSYKTHSLLTR